MSNLVAWGTYDESAVTKELGEFDKGKTEFFKPVQGKNIIRILPAAPGKTSPYKVVHQHYVQTPDKPNGVGFVCPAFAPERGPCPACKMSNELRATGNPVDRDRSFQLRAKSRVFVNVIDRAHPERGPMPWGYGKQIKEELENIRTMLGVDVTHPEHGQDIILVRKGTGKNDTEYSVIASPQAGPISTDPDEIAHWADMLPDLDQYGIVKPLAELYDLLGVPAQGQVVLPAGNNQAQKARKAITSGVRKQAVVEDEDGDDYKY